MSVHPTLLGEKYVVTRVNVLAATVVTLLVLGIVIAYGPASWIV